ncbi:MAG: hypothetical protein JWQ03_2899 [Variovorax sp.]|nr:hypothetical protein [Variovorax sp.]
MKRHLTSDDTNELGSPWFLIPWVVFIASFAALFLFPDWIAAPGERTATEAVATTVLASLGAPTADGMPSRPAAGQMLAMQTAQAPGRVCDP